MPTFKIKKVAALHIDINPQRGNSFPIILPDEQAFLLPLFYQNYWLLSFTSNEWDVTPEDKLLLSAADQQLASSILDKYFPGLKNKTIGARIFCDNYTDNATIGVEAISDDVFYVSGASGSGYRFAYSAADNIIKALDL